MGRTRRVQVVEWIHEEHQVMLIRTSQGPLYMNIEKRDINIEVINKDDKSNHTLQIKMCKIRLRNSRRKPYIAFVMSKEVNGKWYDIVPDSQAEDDGCIPLKLKPHEGDTDKPNRFYLIHRDTKGVAIESICPPGYFLKADHRSKSLCMVKRKPLRGSKRENFASSYHPNEKFQFVDLSKVPPPSEPIILESDIQNPSSKPRFEDDNNRQPFLGPNIELSDTRRMFGPEIERHRYFRLFTSEPEIRNTDDQHDNDDNESIHSDTEVSGGGNEIDLPTLRGREDMSDIENNEEESSKNEHDKTEEILNGIVNIDDFFNDGNETSETTNNTRKILAVIQALARVFVNCLNRNNSGRDEN